jgi:hypothetical protein
MKASALVALSVPEVRRLVCATAAAPEQQRHLLAWSRFRRAHQAGAGRGHTQRRARDQLAAWASWQVTRDLAAPGPAFQLAGTAALTEATWDQIAALLPTLQVAPKRTRYDHRKVLEGILGVMRSARSWRDAPAADVPWPILYQRYSVWRRRGLWDAILCILHPESDLPVVT